MQQIKLPDTLGALKSGVAEASDRVKAGLSKKKSSSKEGVGTELVVTRVQAYEANSNSISLFWTPVEAGEKKIEYQVRYFRTQHSTDGWVYSPIVPTNRITISNLTENTLYTFSVQSRSVAEDETKSPFGADSVYLEIATCTFAKEERLQNLKRVTEFLHNYAEFSPYPDPEHQKDTYLDKASRGFDGLLNVASFVGLGGQYFKVVKKIWEVRGLGLAAVIFRKELQSIVVALGSQLMTLGKELGLSTKEIMIGTYYYMWETKRLRVDDPQVEHTNHTNPASVGDTILAEKAPEDIIDLLAEYFVLARLSYKHDPASAQWILHKLSAPEPDYQLVCFRGRAGHQKPAFCVMASRSRKEVVLSIRGTSQVEDLLTNHSFLTLDVELNLHGQKQTVTVHNGFYQAAKWLLSGRSGVNYTTETEVRETESLSESDLDTEDGGGMFQTLSNFHKSGYKVVLTGHSLGAAVATLTGLLLLNLSPEMRVEVFAFAPPCCVDGYISKNLRYQFMEERGIAHKLDHTNSEKGFFSRIKFVSFVVRDDMVSRLSMHCLKQCALDIKHSKPTWETYVDADAKSLKDKVSSFWAPNQRADPKHMIAKSSSNTETAEYVTVDAEQAMEFELAHDSETRQYVPGVIVHAYRHNGVDKASIVTGKFVDFSRVQAYENMKKDHLGDSIAMCLHGIKAANRAFKQPPQWQPGDTNTNGEVITRCAVCNYFVGWNSSIGASSGAEEVKSSLHCHACGKIVCPSCSDQKRSLMVYGIIRECRICDICDYQYSLVTLGKEADLCEKTD